MAREKKLTVKIFENRELKKRDYFRHFYTENVTYFNYHPLYLIITYNRKITRIMSPTFEYLERNHYYIDLIFNDQEAIRKNDERLIINFKTICERKKKEFDVSLLKSENHDFMVSKMTLYDSRASNLKEDISGILLRGGYVNTIKLLRANENLYYFLNSLHETNETLYSEIIYGIGKGFDFLELNKKLNEKKIFPFVVDWEAGEPFLEDIKKLKSDKKKIHK